MYGSVGRFTVFGTYVFKSKLDHLLQMSAFVLFIIETRRHVKNNVCAVEIKIKWIPRKQMTHENTYRDDSMHIIHFLSVQHSQK